MKRSTTGPAYLQVYRDLQAAITAGHYPRGGRLPSKRALAESYSLSVITVEHAYALLCEEGYCEAREKSGYYVTLCPETGLDGTGYHGGSAPPPPAVPRADTIRFPYSVYARTVRRVLQEEGEALLLPGPGNGILRLRQAICNYLARSRHIQTTPECLVIGAGAEQLYGLIAQMLGKERRFAMEEPGYARIASVYRAYGIAPIGLPLGEDGIDSVALAGAEADVLHITPYRSYPTGVTASASKKQAYLQWARSHGALLIEDDVESELSPHVKPYDTLLSLSQPGDDLLYLNTFSRTLSPALRIGYMVLSPHLLPLYQEKVGFYACPVPVPDQYVLAALLDSGDFERHVRRMRRALRQAP